MQKFATVLFSGGVDSTSCVHLLIKDGYQIFPVFVNFGQPAFLQEWTSVQSIASEFGIHADRVDVSSKTRFATGEIRARNAFLTMTALVHTRATSGLIVIGIHAGSPYYDCSADFLKKLDTLTSETTDGAFAAAAPLLNWTKMDVYSYFRQTGINPELTHSCEDGVAGGCGKCLSCLDRRLL